ncbi:MULTISPECIES: hypothetical protein [unclassified Thiocapsa]|uniref:hypothetical protein n=1 Tax=unclassified Thiocapsa TaxID=2641286 RepID=UPI0035B15450
MKYLLDTNVVSEPIRARPSVPVLPGIEAHADSQIAAIAAVNGLVLVTRNTEDFADFSSLIVENWFDPKIGTGA